VGESALELAKERDGASTFWLSTTKGTHVMSLSTQLLEILVCPKCKGVLEYRENESVLVCHSCRLSYPVRDDIPVMLIDEAKPI